MKHNHKFRFNATIGVRSFKTAFTCLVCALLYLIIDRNPTFACIGVIFGMGSATLRVAKRDYDDKVLYYEETGDSDSSVIDIEIG